MQRTRSSMRQRTQPRPKQETRGRHRGRHKRQWTLCVATKPAQKFGKIQGHLEEGRCPKMAKINYGVKNRTSLNMPENDVFGRQLIFSTTHARLPQVYRICHILCQCVSKLTIGGRRCIHCREMTRSNPQRLSSTLDGDDGETR